MQPIIQTLNCVSLSPWAVREGEGEGGKELGSGEQCGWLHEVVGVYRRVVGIFREVFLSWGRKW